jgi:hypothetical protein
MNKQLTLEFLNEKIKEIFEEVNKNNKGYDFNFNIIRQQFSKNSEMIKTQVNLVDQQETRIANLEYQIRELAKIIHDEVIYYRDRRERPPNPDMYAGGFKLRKTRKKNLIKRRKTRKTRKQ